MYSRSVLTLGLLFCLSFGTVWDVTKAYMQIEPQDESDESAESQEQTKGTTLPEFMIRLFHAQRSKRSKDQVNNSTILFPSDDVMKCEDTHTCSTLDDCTSFSKTNVICGWNDTLPLVCCLKEPTRGTSDAPKPPMNNTILSENECFRRMEDSTLSRKARTTNLKTTNVRDVTRWPFMMSIFERLEKTRKFVCSGVLISRKHVLSAAHCFRRMENESEYDVMRGLVNLESMADNTELFTKRVRSIVVHPDFRVSQLYHDLALLTISDLDFFSPETRPVCLPPSLPGTGTDKGSGVHLGWGNEQFKDGDPFDQLQEMFVDQVNRSTCELKNKATDMFFNKNFPRGITPELICAGNDEFSFYACHGDTAGPLVVLDESNVWRLVGVATVPFSCGAVVIPGIYTRVSSYLDWIKDTAAID